MSAAPSSLPGSFVFGVATAAYQIEGAVTEDGRGQSIWDIFSHLPGRVHQGETGDVACDHYHRYGEDVALMRDLGVDTYRFSIAWPRVLPTGAGSVNPAGLDFYSRLVDALLEAGIEPAATLYHWDLPQALEDLGGWRSRDTAHRFADYAAIVAGHLGDRVHQWITLNEPWCSSMLGYATGRHAPGAREGEGALAAAHHLLLGHGLVVPILRDPDPSAQVGITLNMQPVSAVSDEPGDLAAADRHLMHSNLLFTDPVLVGRYPELARSVYAPITDFGFLRDGDLETISAQLDFLGVNYYFPSHVRAADYVEADPVRRTADDLGVEPVISETEERTTMGWPVEAEGLTRLLTWLQSTYPSLPPVYITENGRACDDVVTPDGNVHDSLRSDYVRDHLAAVEKAMAQGVDVRGYFYWSLMDNFEWAEGYSKRFGLTYVDYATQQRIPKDSFAWFRDLVAAHHGAGEPRPPVDER
jgi:beta-galactosidase